jgi:hypothetical protein
MTVKYALLLKPQADHIRKQRLLDLEADHWRFMLDLEELPEDVPDTETEPIFIRLADVERRIMLHRQALGLPDIAITTEETLPVAEDPDAG